MADAADSGEPKQEHADRREGRGRLSSIDLLPDEATSDIGWANDQLRERKLPANVIFTEFNERLADKGIKPISRSAWNRYSVRQAIQFRKHDETGKMASELVSKLGPNAADDVTVMVAEMLKVAMFEHLEEGKLSTKALQELSRGLASLVAAQKNSLEHRLRLQREEDLKKTAEAVNEVGKKAGVSLETLAEINRALGVG